MSRNFVWRLCWWLFSPGANRRLGDAALQEKQYDMALLYYRESEDHGRLKKLLVVLQEKLQADVAAGNQLDTTTMGQVLGIHGALKGKLALRAALDHLCAQKIAPGNANQASILMKAWNICRNTDVLDSDMKIQIAQKYLGCYLDTYPYDVTLLGMAIHIYNEEKEPFPSQSIRDHAATCLENEDFPSAAAAYRQLKEEIPIDVVNTHIDLSLGKTGALALAALRQEGERLPLERKKEILQKMPVLKTSAEFSVYAALCKRYGVEPSSS